MDPLVAVLSRPLARRDRPTATHYTLEIAAYWRDDFIDAVRADRRRRVTIGGLRSAGRANLAVELPPPLKPYTAARIMGPRARVVVPAEAQLGLRRGEGPIEAPQLTPVRGRFPAHAFEMGLEDRFAFRVGTLTFLVRYVHRDGAARHPYDWLLPARFLSREG